MASNQCARSALCVKTVRNDMNRHICPFKLHRAFHFLIHSSVVKEERESHSQSMFICPSQAK